MKTNQNTTPVFGYLKWLASLALMVPMYFGTYHWLITKDWIRDDYSYGCLIPFLSAYLVWDKRKTLARIQLSESWIGLLPVGIGVFLYWTGELSGEFFSLYLSSWLVFSGLLLVLYGRAIVQEIVFPLLMLIFMFPLPGFINNKVTFQLKLMSSKFGVFLLQISGMTAYREGSVIDLGFTKLQVVDACSGLRYLLPMIILGLLIAYFSKMSFWKKAVMVLSTIPISVVVNGFRIASVGILYQYWGPAVAEGFFHDFSGWFIFMASLMLLLGEMTLLRLIGKRPDPVVKDDEPKTDDQAMNPIQEDASRAPVPEGGGKGWRQVFTPPQFAVALVLLAATLLLSQGIDFREKIPISKPFDRFPLQIGKWNGRTQSMDKEIIAALDLSDYAIINFEDNEGRGVNFYVAYYESQRKGESIHTPGTCLPGSGWEFKQAQKAILPTADPKTSGMPVMRAVMTKGDVNQLSYYWFPTRGRVLTNVFEMKLYNFWDALTRQRTDGALVRLITPIYPQESVQDADHRLGGFSQAILPVLREFLPE